MDDIIKKLNYDILRIDEYIKEQIINEKKKIDIYKKELDKLKKLNKSQHVITKQKELEKKISDMEYDNKLAEYICRTQDTVKNYINIMKEPIRENFTGKVKETEKSKKKRLILNDFMDTIKDFIPISSIHYREDNNKQTIKCKCGNSIEFGQTDNFTICKECGNETENYTIQTTYKDTDRVNMSQKYKYKRIIHFRDTINQYQGKQNKKIKQEIFDILDREFKNHHLLDLTTNDFHTKHKMITKEHIYMFLNETGNNSYYEDINFIHSYFTGIKCPNISDIEGELLSDFNKIIEVYDTLNNDRVNFLNSQYILYQLLKRRKRKIRDIDFSILKTRDRLIEHDNIYGKIAEKLEWNYIPLA